MIDGTPKPVVFGSGDASVAVIFPWCDCVPQGRGFTFHEGQWVRPCCGRPTKQNIENRSTT